MKKISGAMAIAVASGIALAGCAAAGTTTSTAATSGSTVAKESKPAARGGLTHITAYSINTDRPVFASIVSGPAFSDYGRAVEVAPGAMSASVRGDELELRLVHGAFRLNIADLRAKLLKGTAHEPIFRRTCSTYVSVSNNVPIVPGSGTGSYRGIAGSFAMTLTVNEVHNSPCSKSLSILRQVIVLTGMGRFKLAR